MGTEREGQIDQWQRGSVTPRNHNLRRSGGSESRRKERLAEPPADEPSGRELRRARERAQEGDDEAPGEGGNIVG